MPNSEPAPVAHWSVGSEPRSNACGQSDLRDASQNRTRVRIPDRLRADHALRIREEYGGVTSIRAIMPFDA